MVQKRWVDRESPFYVGSPGTRLTARGKEKRVYREQDRRHTKDEKLIRLISGVLLQAFVDYHKAKDLIRRERITAEDLPYIGWQKKDILFAGNDAKAWFTNEPKPGHKGFTYKQCCEVLHYKPKEFWETMKHPSKWEKYKAHLQFMANENAKGAAA